MNVYIDGVNASFEIIAGFLLLLNVREIVRTKTVKGVHLAPAIFFTIWGMWNIFYYPMLKQPISFYAALLVVAANGAWVILAVYYKNKNRRCATSCEIKRV